MEGDMDSPTIRQVMAFKLAMGSETSVLRVSRGEASGKSSLPPWSQSAIGSRKSSSFEDGKLFPHEVHVSLSA